MSIENPVYVKHAMEKADLKLAMVLIAATEAKTNLLGRVFELLRLNAEVDEETTAMLLEEYAPPLRDSLNHLDALIQEIGDTLFTVADREEEEEEEEEEE